MALPLCIVEEFVLQNSDMNDSDSQEIKKATTIQCR